MWCMMHQLACLGFVCICCGFCCAGSVDGCSDPGMSFLLLSSGGWLLVGDAGVVAGLPRTSGQTSTLL